MSSFIPEKIEIRVRKHLLYTYTDGNTIEVGDIMRRGNDRGYHVVDIIDVNNTDNVKPLAILLRTSHCLEIYYSDIEPTSLLARAAESQEQPVPTSVAQRADQGDVDALYHLAFFFREGDGLVQDAVMARDLFRKAAELGHAPAACEYADLLADLEENFVEKHKWYEMAAKFGHVYAMRQLENIYKQGRGVEKNETTAGFWKAHAGALHEVGVDWEERLKAKIATFRQAPPSCDAREQYERAMVIINDDKQRFRDILLAVELLEMSAACGFAAAQYELAEVYLEGKLMRKDSDGAVELLRAAAAQDDNKALYKLGCLNLQSKDSGFSISNGLKLFAKAAEKGSWMARSLLKEFSENKDFQPYNEEAKVWYEALLLKRRTFYDRAVELEAGKESRLDRQQLFHFYKAAADMGFGDAQYKVAKMLEAGDGVEQDWIQAEKYCRLAAQNEKCQDQIQAQFDLALIHELGLCGQRSVGMAVQYYGQAAYKGHAESSYRLAMIAKEFYDRDDQDSLGFRYDYRLYFKEAADRGHEGARQELEKLAPPEHHVVANSEFGSLRALYREFTSYRGEHVWEDVFLPQWSALTEIRKYYEVIKNRPCRRKPWPDLTDQESIDLYCASRLSDMMLLSIQCGDEASVDVPTFSLENYKKFFTHIGFDIVDPTQFHPFSCEIVEVIESDDSTIALAERVWPAVMLGNMMFARAGVRIKSPRHFFAKGVADRSVLFWSYRRKNRNCEDMSTGWGHNSQWSTDFRRDFDLGDRYAYNVDTSSKIDLRESIEDDDSMNDMPLADRIDFLKHRCFTKAAHANHVGSHNFHPYGDYFEEAKE